MENNAGTESAFAPSVPAASLSNFGQYIHTLFRYKTARNPSAARPGDEVQNLLGEHNHNAARDGQNTVGPLGGVVGLEGQAHLEDAVAQQDNANCLDQREDEVAQAVYGSQRVTAGFAARRGESRDGQERGGQGKAGQQGAGPPEPALETQRFKAVSAVPGDFDVFGGVSQKKRTKKYGMMPPNVVY